MFAEVLTVIKTISEVILVFQTDDFIGFFPSQSVLLAGVSTVVLPGLVHFCPNQ